MLPYGRPSCALCQDGVRVWLPRTGRVIDTVMDMPYSGLQGLSKALYIRYFVLYMVTDPVFRIG